MLKLLLKKKDLIHILLVLVGISFFTSVIPFYIRGLIYDMANDTGSTLPNMSSMPKRLCSTKGPTRNFEELIQEYKDKHNAAMLLIQQYAVSKDEALKEQVDKLRFSIVETGHWGIGNRFMGMTSTILFSILTGRILLVDWEPSPSTLSDMFEDPGISWDIANFRSIIRGTYLESTKSNFILLTHTMNHISNLETFDSYVIFLTENLKNYYSDERIVTLKSNQYYVPLLTHNPNYKEFLCTFGSDIFQQLFSNFIHPRKELMELITDYKNTHFVGKKTVGIQIRNLPGDFKFGELPENLWWRCADFISDENTKWFVSAPLSETKEEALYNYGSRILHFEPKNVSDHLKPFAANLQKHQTALIDMWLLGETDSILFTSYSTFGYAAFARVSKEPYVLTQNHLCVKQLGSQPCFHRLYRLWENEELRPLLWTVEMLNQENCPFQ